MKFKNGRIERGVFFICVVFISGCFHGNKSDEVQNHTQSISNVSAVGYTYHSEDGNRLVEGSGAINTLASIDIPLSDSVIWIAAVSKGLESYWAVVLSDGSVKAFKVNGSTYEEVSIAPSQLSMPIPPTLILQNDGSVKLANVFENASVNSSAVVLNETGDRVYVANNGDLVLLSGDTEQRLAINALPYSRLLMDEKKRLLILTQPSTIYDHTAVLGGSYAHASTITLVDTSPSFEVVKNLQILAPDVVEGNSLIWTDVNNDGQREIITTLARSGEGGRLVVFNEDGVEQNASAPIGVDHRWRHQVAVAPFKSPAEKGLVSIYIPHLGPRIEYFRLDDSSMSESSQSVGYSSHLSTGLNIDMGITGDFDGDGKTELLLVERVLQKSIGAFEYGDNGITLDWTLPLSARISSNVAAVTLDNDGIAYGVGQGNSLRIWHP